MLARRALGDELARGLLGVQQESFQVVGRLVLPYLIVSMSQDSADVLVEALLAEIRNASLPAQLQYSPAVQMSTEGLERYLKRLFGLWTQNC